jgi:hypothetical protein
MTPVDPRRRLLLTAPFGLLPAATRIGRTLRSASFGTRGPAIGVNEFHPCLGDPRSRNNRAFLEARSMK